MKFCQIISLLIGFATVQGCGSETDVRRTFVASEAEANSGSGSSDAGKSDTTPDDSSNPPLKPSTVKWDGVTVRGNQTFDLFAID